MGAKYKAVWKEGKLLAEYENGELTYLDAGYSSAKRSDLAMPMVIRDIGEYRSPLDGTMVTTRSQHRDHMRRHDVIEVGNERIGSMSAPEPDKVATNYDLGQAIKRRIEEVEALPQADYDTHVQVQQAEHAEVAALVTATE